MEIEMPDTDATESFLAMLRRVLGSRLKPGAETFPDMFAIDGILEYPYAPVGLNTVFTGRDAIIANFQRIRKILRIDSVAEVSEIGGFDPNVVVIEFTGHGEGLTTGESYDQRYISVIQMRDGSIVRYRDYWNPLCVLQAVKGRKMMQFAMMD